jgi:hypothetical protein
MRFSNHVFFKKSYCLTGIFVFILLFFGTCFISFSQYKDSSHEQPYSLFGPRIGTTLMTGEAASVLEDDYDAFPLITQFGWQFEWRFFSIENGVTGVVEFVALFGGLEQNLFLPSLSIPIGMRTKSGFEFGIGPNLSITGFSIVLAVGKTFTTGQLNWPVNFSIVPSESGIRFSLLFGFNMAKEF